MNCTYYRGHRLDSYILRRDEELKEISERCMKLSAHVKCLDATKNEYSFGSFDFALRTTSADSAVTTLSYGDSAGKDSPLEFHSNQTEWTEILHSKYFVLAMGNANAARLFVADSVVESRNIYNSRKLQRSLDAAPNSVRRPQPKI
jgi:hypothetical protein